MPCLSVGQQVCLVFNVKALKVGGVIGFADCLSQLVDFVSCVAEKGLGGV